MRLLRLQLADYRNFHRLDLSLGPGASVFIGANAQGKTNLLESIYLLATMKELRAESEAQVIRREVAADPIPAARVVGEGETAAGPLKVEVAVVGREGGSGLIASKTAKVNGVPKRLSDAVGRLTAVLFTAADIDLISGAPSARRRYIDITLSQVDSRYVVARSRLERVIAQRNHLLKRMREGLAQADELSFWDAELARDGGYVFAVRSAALSELAALAGEAHASLAPAEELRVDYRPRLEGKTAESLRDADSAAAAYGEALRRGVPRDVAAGMTLQGPHRDDIAFFLDGEPAAGFSSRAQQRTIALALRLAEARLLEARRGEPPLLLLDDILSEMDAARGRSVIEAVSAYDQLLITATGLERFPDGFLDRAAVFRVTAGAVSVAASQPVASRGTAES
ncbi:MAG: DNA replication and repair protein RecF [Dehalococcoidia bacterium]|nr:DNA replication and repair protein RecF [Dehalococcoidia bacterium]